MKVFSDIFFFQVAICQFVSVCHTKDSTVFYVRMAHQLSLILIFVDSLLVNVFFIGGNVPVGTHVCPGRVCSASSEWKYAFCSFDFLCQKCWSILNEKQLDDWQWKCSLSLLPRRTSEVPRGTFARHLISICSRSSEPKIGDRSFGNNATISSREEENFKRNCIEVTGLTFSWPQCHVLAEEECCAR